MTVSVRVSLGFMRRLSIARQSTDSCFFLLQQAKAEQEEEFISNTLLKKIQTLKREKEVLAQNYEQEEECLTNDLSRKLLKVSTKCIR